MQGRFSNYEQETIINFNKDEAIARIFTCEKTWQRHLEKGLGSKPTMDDGFGGKEYEIDKKRIRPPRVPVKLSAEARAEMVNRAKGLHQKPVLRGENTAAVIKSNTKSKNKNKATNQ